MVRVKVRCCGLNTSDYLVANGEYDFKPSFPYVPGYEVSGKITEVGSTAASEGFAVGDRVVVLNKLTFGGLAEECIAKTMNVWQLPSSVTYKQSASLADPYATSLLGLSRRAQVTEKDTLLINAGAGGLGLAAVDIAANLYKAKVIAVCETEDKAALLRERGAWAALTYDPKDIQRKVNEVTEGKGVRIVFDALGGPFFHTALQCVAHEGMVIVAGFAIRRVKEFEPMELLPKACSLLGVSLRNYLINDPDVYRQAVQDALDMCEQELISPYISKEFDLEHVNEAFQHIKDVVSVGKIVVNISEG
ncbi:quinone oxidoreductase-like protein 2 homolog isoform X2 [Anabrus simplex]|uniref:quinone oxidoreductase-like protein 2 homolog isoform X2 n=1 Tax=Anabrus simplex TaxID=316456 RepID=UPI0035A2F2E8